MNNLAGVLFGFNYQVVKFESLMKQPKQVLFCA